MTLLRLWVPIKQDEDHSFIFHYPSCTPDQTLSHEQIIRQATVPFHQYPALTMHKAFASGYPQNLGALTLLNLLMGSKLNNNSLGIVESDSTESPYFTQVVCDFWCDFLTNSPAPHLFNSTISFDEQLTGFLMNHHEAWWKTAFEGGCQTSETSTSRNLNELFRSELFETALRIYLTPINILTRIERLTLNQHSQPFIDHFLTRIELFKYQFVQLLSVTWQVEWKAWLVNDGLIHALNYMKHISQFKVDNTPVLHHSSSIVFLENYMQAAIALHLPDVHILFHTNEVIFFHPSIKIKVFYYLISVLEEQWPHITKRLDDPLWIYINEFIKGLRETLSLRGQNIRFTPQNKSFLADVLMKCIQLKKDDLMMLILYQDNTLVNVPIRKAEHLLPEDEIWANHSLLYFAQSQGNEDMVTYLKTHGARLLHNEISQADEPSSAAPKTKNPRIYARRASFWIENEGASRNNNITSSTLPAPI